MADFLQRLKQHKMVQWALAYLAAAWVLLQVIDLVGQQFGWSTDVLRGITVALAVGFFVALLLAWYHGERGVQRVTGTELLILAVLLALGGVFLWHFARTPRAMDIASVATSPSSVVPEPISTAAIPAKSIAVLPFENLSTDKGNAYFADGMQDLILTKLADIGDLKVISRTSTMKYVSHPDDLRTIARQLGAATVLEGSVQKVGNQVLINVQLIDAQTDNHLWAQAYPRTLDNIFGVEGEVAQKVADALKVKLQPAKTAQLAKVSTADPTAFDNYLRAGHFMTEVDAGGWAMALPKAIAAYQQAVAQDPKFAQAWAGLSFAQSVLNYTSMDRSAANMQAAEENAKRALALAPDLPDAHVAMGYVYRLGHRDYETARAQYQQALQERPNDADTVASIAYIDMIEGNLKESIVGLERATALDPRNAHLATQLAKAYAGVGDYAKAIQALVRAVAIDPQDAEAYAFLARYKVMATGDVQQGLEVLNTMATGTPANSWVANQRIRLFLYQRNFAAARQTAATLADKTGADALTATLERGDVEWLAGSPALARPFYLTAVNLLRTHLTTDPDDDAAHAALGLAYARLGRPADALNAGTRAVTIAQHHGDRLDEKANTVGLAQIEVATGDNTVAIKSLQQAMSMPGRWRFSAVLLKLDPTWDPIRNDLRFQALLKKYASAQPANGSSGAAQ